MAQPDLIIIPFASDALPGYVDSIPDTLPPGSDPQNASWENGFPPVTMTPLAAGGIPPRGQSFNGVLKAISEHTAYVGGGGQYTWSNEYVAKNGGYPKGAMLASVGYDGYWQNTVDLNASNPDSGGAGWIQLSGRGSNFAIDTGTANTYVCSFIPEITVRQEGQVLKFKVKTANTGISTFNDGLGSVALVGASQNALQGGELIANGDAWVQWNTSVGGGSYILLFCTGAAEQVAPATKSQHAIQLQQMAAVVGGARNASMIVATASATATFTADEVAVKTALGGQAWLIPNFNKNINLATTGAGGMDTGTAPANGFVALYAIYNPTTGVSALLARDATSIKAPEVYGGANMPAGYTASALVSVVPTNASSQIKACTQFNRSIDTAYQAIFTTTTPTITPTLVSASAVVPKNASAVTLSIAATESSAGSGVAFSVSGSSAQVSIITVQAVVSGQTSSSAAIGKILLQAPQQLYYFMLNLSAISANIGAYGYEF